ncbi:MAG TPA: menaquinone biosynthesis prenyltransferase MqnP [Frankiaceae bacterium]
MTVAEPARRPGPPVIDEAEVGHVTAFLKLVVIEHSVFALPFAYIATLTASFDASAGHGIRWWRLLAVTVAMVAARTFAMAMNRLVDRRLDAQNPRTANRELVTGMVAVRTAAIGSVVSAVVFLAICGAISWLCLALAPVALALCAIYPYGKRFTWLCHALLGLAQMVAPIGAWLATTGHWSWASVALGGAVGLWIGGFDLIYALQDMAADRVNGVYSLPARFGARVALHVSTAAHVVTFALFVVFGLVENFGALWYVGLAAAAAGFVYQHRVVTPTDFSRVGRAFMTANAWIGVVLFVFALADLAVRGLAW